MATDNITENNIESVYTSQDKAVSDFVDTRDALRNVSIESSCYVPAGNTTILDRGNVPEFHKRMADSFMIIRKIYGFPIIQSKLNHRELELLNKYKFNLLEESTYKQVRDQIHFLRDLYENGNKEERNDSNKLLEIRNKELKHLIASNFVEIKDNIFNGYRALEKYFEDISKYKK